MIYLLAGFALHTGEGLLTNLANAAGRLSLSHSIRLFSQNYP